LTGVETRLVVDEFFLWQREIEVRRLIVLRASEMGSAQRFEAIAKLSYRPSIGVMYLLYLNLAERRFDAQNP